MVGLAISLAYLSGEGGIISLAHGGYYLPSRRLEEGEGGDKILVMSADLLSVFQKNEASPLFLNCFVYSGDL
jgi:hypothetical protein